MILTEDIEAIRERMPEPSRYPDIHYRANIRMIKQGLGLNYEFPVRLMEEKNQIITFTKSLVAIPDTDTFFWCWKCDLDGQLYI